jgi:cobalt-zinc-cadmium efflux system outer membrane protein
MSRPFLRALAFLGLVGSCARYTPAPLDPTAVAVELGSRNLHAPGLDAFRKEHGSTQPDGIWSVTDFVLTALFFSPALDRLRAEWRAAQAAVISAGGRPRPDLEAEAGYGVTGTDAFESPWVAALATVFTIELGGKRGARVTAARARAAQAEIELDVAAWEIDRRVRTAMQDWVAARSRVDHLGSELALRHALADAAAARYARGELRRTEIAALETAVVETGALLSERSAQQLLAQQRFSSVVGASAIPRSFPRQGPADCGAMENYDTIRHAAILSRPDVGRALAAYAVAEADVRLAVAGLAPDLRLGPGFTWDQGVGRWSLIFGITRLPVGVNRGPVREALHRRDAAAAAVAEAELRVMTELAEAFDACLAARDEIAQSEKAIEVASRQVTAAREAYQRGEIGAEDTLAARLPLLRALAVDAEVRLRLTAAALQYEEAQGIWGGGDIRQPDPRRSPRRPEPEL